MKFNLQKKENLFLYILAYWNIFKKFKPLYITIIIYIFY
jgi:hypothetical protein